MNRTTFITVAIALVVGAVIAILPGKTVLAATGLTIQPIKISQTLKPGSTVTGTIKLSNASTDDVTLDIAVEDFIPTAGTETFQFVGRAPGVTTVRDWITINSPLHIIFKKGEVKEVPYTIVAPASAEPGDHFGVLFFKATKIDDTASSIQVGTQVGVLVFVTIPGDFQQKGQITDFTTNPFVQGGPVDFNLTFENTGTVHYVPQGTIDIANMFGSKVGSVPIEGYVVLPTGIKIMPFRWNVNGLLMGKYVATASIFDTAGHLLTSRSAVFYAFPIWYIVGFIIVLIIVFFIIRFLKSRLHVSISLKK
jgi:uncharacterized repeat protein (TIGR01451 family)